MCGIIGYYCFGEARPKFNNLKKMFIACSSRGTDATGYAYLDKNNKLVVQKDGITARKFVETEAFLALRDNMPKYLTGHCRAGTSGSEKDNENNHPIYSKLGTAIAHNGIISNDDTVFEKKKYVRDGKVDSEVILRVIDEKLDTGLPEAIKNLSILSGGMAVSIISEKFPGFIALAKHTNPVVLGYDIKNDIVYYASTEDIIEAGFYTHKRGFAVLAGGLHFSVLEDEWAVIIGKEGVEDSFKFYDSTKTLWATYKYQPGHRTRNEGKQGQLLLGDNERIQCLCCLKFFPAKEMIVSNYWGEICPSCWRGDNPDSLWANRGCID